MSLRRIPSSLKFLCVCKRKADSSSSDKARTSMRSQARKLGFSAKHRVIDTNAPLSSRNFQIGNAQHPASTVEGDFSVSSPIGSSTCGN